LLYFQAFDTLTGILRPCSVFPLATVAMVYIRAKQLPKLHEYKYAGVDRSLVSKYILKPFYTHVVIKCFPLSIAYAFPMLWPIPANPSLDPMP
jgi:hypothetical protein